MTIFIAIYDSLLANSILRTDVVPTLLERNKDLRVVVLADKSRVEEYKKIFNTDRVVVEGVDVNPMSNFERRWASFIWHTVSSATLTIQLYGGPLSPRRNFLNRTATYALRFIFGNVVGRALLRTIDFHLFRTEPYATLFETYKPTAVFAANVYAPLDTEVIREAKRRAIPTIGMVKSWDNVTSRGLIRALPDECISQSYLVREQLHAFADLPLEKTTVSGVPQYDIYFRPDDEERVSFWKRFGIDGTRKVILFLEPGLKLSPHGYEVWQMLDTYIENKGTEEPVEAFISVHPAYPYNTEAAEKLKHAKIVRFGYQLKGGAHKTWEFSKDAYADLMRVVRYCDLVITTASTMNIESSIFDKPVINIAFDGTKKLPYNESVRQYYDYSHLLPIVQSGGVKVAYSKEELFENIDLLLKHPEWGREGRRKIVEEQCVYIDGRSAERIATAILAFMSRRAQ